MQTEPKPDRSDNPRDFVDKLDALIKLRIQYRSVFAPDVEEQAELLKRDLTDYLLLNDKRAGIFVKGDKQ